MVEGHGSVNRGSEYLDSAIPDDHGLVAYSIVIDNFDRPAQIEIGMKKYTLTPVDPDQELRDRVIAQIDSNPYDNKLYDAFRRLLDTTGKSFRNNYETSNYSCNIQEGEIVIEIRVPNAR